MRTLTPLVALTLSALTGTAGAQETTPAAATASATTEPAATASVEPPPATATAAATPAVVQADALPAPAPTTSERKWQVGLSFLPMSLGKYTYSDTFTSTVTSEAYFAYGLGLSGGYEILRGLVVGLAPQVIFNVQPKPSDTANPPAAMQIDFLARVAYGYRVANTLSVYAEVMPGYSRIDPSDEARPSWGFVLALGAGCAMDLTDRYFLNVAGGYQIGFQSQSAGVHELELRTKYVRVAVGGGIKF